MSPSDLLTKLEQDGTQLELSLRSKNLTDEHRALITEHRDELITAIAFRQGLHIPVPMLKSLMVWTRMYHELRIQHPDGLTLNATPEHVRDAVVMHTWGTVYITDEGGRWLILSWGNVPTYALMNLRRLETEEPIIAEQVAA